MGISAIMERRGAAGPWAYRGLWHPASHEPITRHRETNRELARSYVPGTNQTSADELTHDVSSPPSHDVLG
jgi:hypothetical protein